MPSLQWCGIARSMSSLPFMRKTRRPWLRMTSTRCKCSLLSRRGFHFICTFVSEQSSFLPMNSRRAFLCPERTLCGSGHWWSFGMRRSPSSTAWPATTPSLCLATFQDGIAHVANLTFFALLSQEPTYVLPSSPASKALWPSSQWRASTKHLSFDVLHNLRRKETYWCPNRPCCPLHAGRLKNMIQKSPRSQLLL